MGALDAMNLPETCPFCGAGILVMPGGFECRNGRWATFDCRTSIHAGQAERRTQSRTCEDAERTRLSARLAALEAEAKQAREDEAWAIREDVDVMSGHGEWTAQFWVSPADGWISETATTIHAAIRALRAKVEGGAR